MVEVPETAEDCTFLCEAFQKIISDGGLVVLIFEYNEQHMVEMLWQWDDTGPGGSVLRKTENRENREEKCFKRNLHASCSGRGW